MTDTRLLVPEHRRLPTTAALFGNAFPFQIEPAAYYWADRLSPDYHGGYWLFYTVGPAFYMAPDSDTGFDVLSPNGYEGHLSAEAFGIVVCLFTYISLAFKSRPGFASVCGEHYHRLRGVAVGHSEVGGILAACD